MSRRLIYVYSLVLVLSLVSSVSAQAADVTIRSPDTMPVIDGVVDDVWSHATEQAISITVSGSAPSSPADCSGTWRALWNWEYLYVLVEVNDEALRADSGIPSSWNDDSVEVYVDGDNSKGDTVDENDHQFTFRWNTTIEPPRAVHHGEPSLEGVEYAVTTTNNGYLFEIKLPWMSIMGEQATSGQLIGIEVWINDDDDGGDRDSQISWYGTSGEGWQTPSMWATGLLVAGNKAANPSPADGALYPYTYAALGWLPGIYAVSHDVYFGDNFTDVNDGTGDTFQGNQTELLFILGIFEYPYPDGLVPGTTYYWRIDEVSADGTIYKGDVWSFSIPPKKAHYPNPADGAGFIDTDVTLTWTAGYDARVHDVYFGDDFDTVNNATEGTRVAFTSYTPGPLEYDKTYYWRVDETDAFTTHKGDVWSFTTTLAGLGTIVQEKWNNIGGTDLDTLKDYWKYPNNPDETKTLNRFDTGAELDDNYGGRVHGWLYVPTTGDYTFWLCADDQGELWLSTDEDSSNIRLIASESTWSPPNTWGSGEERSDPISLVGGNKYYIMALWKEAEGGDHCQVAWQGPGVPTRTIIPGTNLSLYEPLNAYGARPTNNATGVTQTPILQWKPGIQAASHEVYFGTDKDAVENATKVSPQYKVTRALGDESFNPGKLAWESTYYWRIDEVNNVNPDSPWIGSVWSFTTADFIIIDDFEFYDSGENQIWYAWRDGLGFGSIGVPPYSPGNGTGSAVGDENTNSYTEESIVHGGGQSMPYWYDNNKPDKAKYSEAKMMMGTARDWTEGGVKAMSLWFQGYPASVGSFIEGPTGTYTMTASGTDITGQSDEFHYAYKMLTGPGTIVAKVESVQNTNEWAKAGVMIRNTLDPNSAHAMAFVTPEQGVVFEYRPAAGQDNVGAAGQQTGVTAPHWVRLERDISGNFTASHSVHGSAWEIMGTPQIIAMNQVVYIGLALTAHNAAATCESVFSNVTITDQVSQQWMNQDIGIQSNDPEPMYVAVANNTGPPAVVYHDNPNAAQIDTWTEWNIDLKEFADKGVSLTDVNSITIGFGNRNNPQAGGSGKMYFDDIRLYRPRYVPGKGTPLLADLNSDGVVDIADVEVMAADWLENGPALAGDVNTDSTIDFKDYAVLADMWLKEQLWPEW